MGCLGYNDYNKVYTTLSEQVPFTPVSGFTLQDRQYIGSGLKRSNPGPRDGPPVSDQEEDTLTLFKQNKHQVLNTHKVRLVKLLLKRKKLMF